MFTKQNKADKTGEKNGKLKKEKWKQKSVKRKKPGKNKK